MIYKTQGTLPGAPPLCFSFMMSTFTFIWKVESYFTGGKGREWCNRIQNSEGVGTYVLNKPPTIQIDTFKFFLLTRILTM